MAANVPKLDVSQAKLDKLTADLAKLSADPVVKVSEGSAPVPTFQRQGYLEKLGHSRRKWFKRFFVLRDSFLLSYNLQKSDFTVEPRACIHLGNSKIQLVSHEEKGFCFYITTMEKDQFLFAASDEKERDAWLKDLEVARTITHANMVKLAVENQCLAEEKGVADAARDATTSALALFSNSEYIKNTPLTGGAEGWLRTLGFNPDYKGQSLFKSRKSQLKKCYFMLRDSHLLMFNGGDILTKPRGVMYLVGTETISSEAEDGMFSFICRSKQCGDMIELVANSEKQRMRWVQALQIGARVTFPDFKLLLKEHDIIASLTLTPRAAAPDKPNQPALRVDAPPHPLLAEDVDLQGNQLDPGTHQAYDEGGNPIFRNPEGRLVNTEGQVLPAKTPRFAASGQQLDPFNRPLPPGAVPMFNGAGVPIGVGPDGRHYLPDGTEVDLSEPHFDADGNNLGSETVEAAGQVATEVSVAIKVRTMLKADGSAPEAVDVLGRTFRDSTDKRSEDGFLVNADGDKVPMKSARRIETNTGALVEYQPPGQEDSVPNNVLLIKIDDEGDEHEIGQVEISNITTLKDVRAMIREDVLTDFPDFSFLINNIQLLLYEESDRLAVSCLPEITIRGKELKKAENTKKFTKKIEVMILEEEKRKREAEEFSEIMARVRQGAFLKATKPQTELEP